MNSMTKATCPLVGFVLLISLSAPSLPPYMKMGRGGHRTDKRCGGGKESGVADV